MRLHALALSLVVLAFACPVAPPSGADAGDALDAGQLDAGAPDAGAEDGGVAGLSLLPRLAGLWTCREARLGWEEPARRGPPHSRAQRAAQVG